MSQYFNSVINRVNIKIPFTEFIEKSQVYSLKISCGLIYATQHTLYNLGFEKKNKFLYSNINSLESSKEIRSYIYKYIYSILTPNDSENQDHFFNRLICKVIYISSSFFAVSISLLQEIAKEIFNLFKEKKFFESIPNINEKNIFPEDFLKGTATCTYQDSGNFHNSQWNNWENKVIKNSENRSDHSANLFTIYKNNPEEIIDRLKKLNINSYRFSIEWSQIQPTISSFDYASMMVYKNLCCLLNQNGIKPMVTLHHFSEPSWFHDLGSFENEENIIYFESFSEFVAIELKNEVEYFCTINEPNVEAFSRFIRGAFSPGYKIKFSRALEFLRVALLAHNKVYQKIKAINHKAQIGFTHQYLRFIAGNFLLTPVTDILTRFVNDLTLKILKKGRARLKIPFILNKKIKLEIKSDFIGVQYYTRPIISLSGSTTRNKKEEMTLMPFREDPEGLYEAITEVYNASKKPIIITENGISTISTDQRKRYMQNALKIISLISKDILKGYFLWSFTKNFEWDMGMNPQNFGAFDLFKQNGKIEIKKDPKPGIEDFINFKCGL